MGGKKLISMASSQRTGTSSAGRGDAGRDRPGDRHRDHGESYLICIPSGSAMYRTIEEGSWEIYVEGAE